MRAGRLRHLIKIQVNVGEKDRMGQLVDQWETIAEPRAGMRSVNGRRFISKSGEAVEATHVFTMRHRTDVAPECRILLGNRHFDIVFADNVDSRNRELQVVAIERVR